MERIVGATVVQVMAHTGDKESQNLYIPKKRRKTRVKDQNGNSATCVTSEVILATKTMLKFNVFTCLNH